MAPSALSDPDWYRAITSDISKAEYTFTRVQGEAVWSAPNREQELRSRVSVHGLELFSREVDRTRKGASWVLKLCTTEVGRKACNAALPQGELVIDAYRAELNHGVLKEWFTNRPDGVEQGWMLNTRPAGDGLLEIRVEVGGGFRFRPDANKLGGVLWQEDVELPYRGLVAVDSEGEELEAHLEATPFGFAITVDDRGAAYPVTVDPVLGGWSQSSAQANAAYGCSVAIIGDVNGDGFDDIAVGAHSFDAGQSDEGRVWVYHGSATGPSQTADWHAEGNQVSARFGEAVAAAGDVNGDGFDDFMVSAPLYDNGQTSEGRVWVYHGSPSGLSSADWSVESNQLGARLGLAISSAGDVNGDGFDDVLIGAPFFDQGQSNEGLAWAFYGSPNGLSAGSNWFASGNQVGALFGSALASAGDVNSDGFDDILVGARLYDGPEINEGRVWRFDGGPGGLSPSSSWFVDSNQAGSQLGTAVAGAGDINGDGFDDVLIGAPLFDVGSLVDSGAAWIFYGGLVNPTGSDWFGYGTTLHRPDGQSHAHYGHAVAGAGDMNGDGYDDIIVGAPQWVGTYVRGGAWRLLGSPVGIINDWSWFYGPFVSEETGYGFAVAGGGDVNGDGFGDTLVGAPTYTSEHENEGHALLWEGPTYLGEKMCSAAVNSTGFPARTLALGSPSVSAGALEIQVSPLPDGGCYLMHGSTYAFGVLGIGFLCVTGDLHGEFLAASSNSLQHVYDNSTPLRDLSPFIGQTRIFQVMFSDKAEDGSTATNLSDAVAVTIHP